jgi:hypothetical protein
MATRVANVFVLAAHVAAIAWYLYFASMTWPDQGGMTGAGDAFIWGFAALPALLISIIVDSVWAFWLYRRRAGWRYWQVAVALWVATFAYDVARARGWIQPSP